MGFVHEKDIELHLSKNKNICLKYKFINKNGAWDYMYISISKEIFNQLKPHFQNEYYSEDWEGDYKHD